MRLVNTKEWRDDLKHLAIKAVGAMGLRARNAVPALAECLQGDPGESLEAVRSLGLIGPDARSAVPELRRLHAELEEQAETTDPRLLRVRKEDLARALVQIEGRR